MSVAAPALRRRALAAAAPDAITTLVVSAYAALLLFSAPAKITPDTWLDLVLGRSVAAHGLPQHDALTGLGAGRTWIDQQWLAHLGLYGLWQTGGLVLAAIASTALLAAAVGTVLTAARWRGAAPLRVLIVALPCVALMLPNTGVRAQSLAQLLFALLLVLLCGCARRPGRRVWLSVPILVVWANVHGSVLMGAALVALYALCAAVAAARARRPAAVAAAAGLLAAAALATLASPYGAGLVDYYRSTALNGRFYAFLAEWRAPTLPSQPLLFVVAAAVVWLAARGRSRLHAFELLALGLTLVGALQAVRGEIWLALCAMLLVPALLEACWPERGASPLVRRLIATLAVTAVVACGLAAGRLAADGDAPLAGRYWPPVAAAAAERALAADPALRVLAADRFPDWLLWADPAAAGRVAFDARFELVGSGTFAALDDVYEARQRVWRTTLSGYRLLVFDPAAHPALERALHTARARTLYADPSLVVALRPNG